MIWLFNNPVQEWLNVDHNNIRRKFWKPFFFIYLYSTTLSSFFVFDLRNLLLVWLLFYRWAMWAHDPCLKFQLQPYMKFSFNLATFSALYNVRLFALDPDHQCVWELAHFDITYTCPTSQKFSDTPSSNELMCLMLKVLEVSCSLGENSY